MVKCVKGVLQETEGKRGKTGMVVGCDKEFEANERVSSSLGLVKFKLNIPVVFLLFAKVAGKNDFVMGS